MRHGHGWFFFIWFFAYCTVPAQVVFDNGPPDLVSSLLSDARFGHSAADDFVLLPGCTRITGVRWWGYYGIVNDVADLDDFTIRIYEQLGDMPALSPSFEILVGHVTRTGTGDTITGLDVFEYSATIDPIQLCSDSTYYVSIQNDTPTDSDFWFWAGSATVGDAFGRSDGPWMPQNKEAAFVVIGDSVPLPGPTVLLLAVCVGIVGLITLRYNCPVLQRLRP